MNTYRTIYNICETLAEKARQANDVDYRAAEEAEAVDAIISLYTDCYDAESFLEFLDKYDCDIFADFRYADFRYYEDMIQEIEENEGDTDGTYNIDFAEFKQLEDEDAKIEYIKNHCDGLFYTDKGVCVSW